MSFVVLRRNYTQVHYQVRIKFKVINRETHALQVGHPIVICTPFPGLQYFTRLHYFMQFTITSTVKRTKNIHFILSKMWGFMERKGTYIVALLVLHILSLRFTWHISSTNVYFLHMCSSVSEQLVDKSRKWVLKYHHVVMNQCIIHVIANDTDRSKI
jgi:hypothetical protein